MTLAASAWERWQALGWPSTRLEAWRNFSTRAFDDLDVTAAIAPGAEVPAELVARLPCPRVVLVDGRVAPALSIGADRGVVVRTVGREALADPTGGFAGLAGEGALESLNTALLGEALVIDVPSAGADGGVLHVVHLVTGAGTAHVRMIVRLAPGASLTLGATHLGLTTGRYLVNAVTELDLAPGASLAYGKHVAEGPEGAHLEAVHARVAAAGSLRTFTLTLAGQRVRTGIDVALVGEGAFAEVDGLYLGKGRSKLDHVTDIRHEVPDTRSVESWSGVVDERAECGFQGVIRIAAGAVRSETRQLTRTLLLSNDAEAHAKPELHIDCDDVQASHGATVGQLDPLEQFYLESRGIPRDDARRILVRAFVERQLAAAPAALRPMFDRALADALGTADDSVGDLA